MCLDNNMEAFIESINISQGGIPKKPVTVGIVKVGGLEGDGHHHEKHNTPLQAVSLQDIERLDELNKQGYHLMSGMTGENLTLRHLDVNGVALGTRLKFAGGVVIELTKVRKPCYVLDAIDAKLKEDIVGRCGVYAKVIQEGALAKGEKVWVE